MKLLSITTLAVFIFSLAHAQESYQPIVPFLQKHCVKCHGPDEVKGDVRLDNIDAIDAQLWIDIYDQLKEGEMPPKKEAQPSEDLRKEMIALVDKISRDERLLGLSAEFYDPAATIFDDEIEKGFDTNSESLFISNDLLLEYLRSSTISLKTALFTEETEKPSTQKTTFSAKQLVVQGQLSIKTKSLVVQKQRKGGIYPAKYDSVIPTTGQYRMTAVAAGVGRNPNLPAHGGPFRMNLSATFAGTSG